MFAAVAALFELQLGARRSNGEPVRPARLVDLFVSNVVRAAVRGAGAPRDSAATG
jgi:hypothetical protein